MHTCCSLQRRLQSFQTKSNVTQSSNMMPGGIKIPIECQACDVETLYCLRHRNFYANRRHRCQIRRLITYPCSRYRTIVQSTINVPHASSGRQSAERLAAVKCNEQLGATRIMHGRVRLYTLVYCPGDWCYVRMSVCLSVTFVTGLCTND
jgi:hypothetical protein